MTEHPNFDKKEAELRVKKQHEEWDKQKQHAPRDKQADFEKLVDMLKEQGEVTIVKLIEALNMEIIIESQNYITELLRNWIIVGGIKETPTSFIWMKKELVKNYIDTLAASYYLLDTSMSYDVATACGSSTLSMCVPNVIVRSHKGDLSLEEMNIIIGLSGITKTLPLKKVRKLAKELGLKMPSFTTTEGARNYFAEMELDEKHEETGEYKHEQYGIIVEDELGAKFTESKTKVHMAGSIELYSKFWDHYLDSNYLAGQKEISPRAPYVNVIGATITNALSKIPDEFFTQGLAGRFNWTYIDVANYKWKKVDITDTTNIDKAEKNLSRCADKLSSLLDRCNDMSKPIYVYMDKSVLNSFWTFDKETTVDWKQKALSNPFHYNYQYKKRLSEMAIKQAGHYCIGRNIDHIINHGFDDSIVITGEDMERGIARMKVSDKHLNDIFAQRMLATKIEKLGPNAMNNRQYTPEYVLKCLVAAPNKMATSGQWYALTNMSNRNQFTEYKDLLLKKGLVRLVDKKSIKDKYEITRLETCKSAVKIYEVTRNKNSIHS